MPLLHRLDSQIFARVRQAGPISRADIAMQLAVRPNSVGDAVGRLIQMGLLTEGKPESRGRGRPHLPLSIDPRRKHVIGLALERGHVGLAKLNLLGQTLEPVIQQSIASPMQLVEAACKLLTEHLSRRVLAVGLSTAGFVDQQSQRLLLSSVMPGTEQATLRPLFEAAGKCPVLLDNDMHALAAAWAMAHPAELGEDVLLVDMTDGAIGGALIINGRPNRGCVVSANEIGHTRCAAQTPRCFCGQIGCLEQLFSSLYLGTTPGSTDDLANRIARCDPADQPLQQILHHLGWGLANAVNLIRPTRVILHVRFAGHESFVARLRQSVQNHLLGPLVERVSFEDWQSAPPSFPQAAGWLALADLIVPEWHASAHTHEPAAL